MLDATSGFVTYLWNDLSTGETITVSGSGLYHIAVTDTLGCEAYDTVQVTVFPNPVVDLGPDTTLCDGGAVTLDAGAGFTGYLWQDGSDLQTFSVLGSGIYSVTVSDINGCTGQDNVDVNINSLGISCYQ